LRIVVDSAASAANTNARLVSDFEPGSCTVASMGRPGYGAAQTAVEALSGLHPLCAAGG
jgi:hypothetical protein